MQEATDVNDLFDPDRVAVVGATDREGSVGRAVLANLAEFDGDVVAVNPSRQTVLEYPCYPDLASVPDPIDLAVIVVPPDVVLDVVRAAGETGVPAIAVITAGFGEAGAKGAARERELVALAKEYDIELAWCHEYALGAKRHLWTGDGGSGLSRVHEPVGGVHYGRPRLGERRGVRVLRRGESG